MNTLKKRKFYRDVIISKLFRMFRKSLLNFINQKIYDKKQLKQFSILKFPKLSFINKQLFQKTLGDFFSTNDDYNKNIIKKLIIEDKEFENIFNKTILECLEHFRGTKNIDGLEGLENEYSKMIQRLEERGEDEEYILKFIIIIYSVEKKFL